MGVVVGLSNSRKLAQKVAKASGMPLVNLEVASFPDAELYLRFPKAVRGKELFLVQSFYPAPNNALLELVFAAKAAKELGAKKVNAIIPYLAFMRQDKRFKKGECISAHAMAEILSRNVENKGKEHICCSCYS